jgi:uracil-DNA glycosylase family 4
VTSDAPHDDAGAPRRPISAAAALRALLEEADAFGTLGFGADSASEADATPPAAAAGTATVDVRTPAVAERAGTPSAAAPRAAEAPPPAVAPVVAPAVAPVVRRDLVAPTVAAAPAAASAPPAPSAREAGDDVASRRDALARIAEEAEACRRCPLGGLRTRAVAGQGNPLADYFFVGEAPGAEEDASGLAFVGPAGQLLTKMIEAMGLSRDDVFIANVLKCRPPMNRDPAAEEVAQCAPFLRRQLAVVRPRVVVCLGGHAARALIPGATSVGKLRGTAQFVDGVPAVATYHPSYLLRAPWEKAKAWEDLKAALRLLGREPPPRAGGAAG